jgi:hypothetical protein
VSPNKIVIQKAPDNHVINFPDAVGVLHVNVLQAMDLPAADWSTGQCDPYVKLRLNSKRSLLKKGGQEEKHTKMVEANRFPVWSEHFEFRCFNEASDSLEITVWDYDTLTAHDFLGKATLKLSKVIQSVEKNGRKHVTEWLKIGGDSKLEVEYWYDRIVEEEPTLVNVDVEDYEYRLGTEVGEDQKTVAPKVLTAEEIQQLELVGAAGITQVSFSPSLSPSLPLFLSPSLPLSLSPSLPLSLSPSLPLSLSPSLSLSLSPPARPLSLSLSLLRPQPVP